MGGANAPATASWPQCSLDLHGIVVHLPVDRTNPFGRSLRVTLGGLSARDMVTAQASAAAAASVAPVLAGEGGGPLVSKRRSSVVAVGDLPASAAVTKDSADTNADANANNIDVNPDGGATAIVNADATDYANANAYVDVFAAANANAYGDANADASGVGSGGASVDSSAYASANAYASSNASVNTVVIPATGGTIGGIGGVGVGGGGGGGGVGGGSGSGGVGGGSGSDAVGGGGGVGAATTTAHPARRVGIEASLVTIGAAWTRGIAEPLGSIPPQAEQGRVRSGLRDGRVLPTPPTLKSQSRQGTVRADQQRHQQRQQQQQQGGAVAAVVPVAVAVAAAELYPVDGEETVVLDVRNPVTVKVRLIDEGTPDHVANGGGGGGGGGGVGGEGRGDSKEGGDADEDLEIAELPPPVSVVREVRSGWRRACKG